MLVLGLSTVALLNCVRSEIGFSLSIFLRLTTMQVCHCLTNATVCFAVLISGNWRSPQPLLLTFKNAAFTGGHRCAFGKSLDRRVVEEKKIKAKFSAIACRTAFACPRLWEIMSDLCGVLAHIAVFKGKNKRNENESGATYRSKRFLFHVSLHQAYPPDHCLTIPSLFAVHDSQILSWGGWGLPTEGRTFASTFLFVSLCLVLAVAHFCVVFFCTSLLLHVPEICILCSPGFDLPLGSWLDFQTSSRGQCARSSVVLCLFYTVCIWGFISHFQWSGSTDALCISAWQFITNMPRPLTVTIATTPQMSASPAACNVGFNMLYWGKEKKIRYKERVKKKRKLV